MDMVRLYDMVEKSVIYRADKAGSRTYPFKNVVHSLESGETPIYSASHQAPNYVQRSFKQNMKK